MVNKHFLHIANKLSNYALVAGVFLLASTQTVSAATINLSPENQTVNVNAPFNVNVVISGANESFNAAQALVIPSSNFSVNALTLGNCNFSFVKTPSTNDPSFTGVMLGNSSKQCTAYTLSLMPKTAGNGALTIVNGSIKRFGDAAEIFTSADQGNYTIHNSSQGITNILSRNNNTPTQAGETALPTVSPSTAGTYTLQVTVTGSNNTPLSNTQVTLNPPPGSSEKPQIVTTNAAGVATFTNVHPDAYTVTATNQKGQPIASNIINVSGKNSILTLGMQEQKAPTSILPFLLVAMIVLGGILLLAPFRGRLRAFFIKT